MHAKDKVVEILALADVAINGDRPFDIEVHDERLYGRILASGSLGFGEAYMDGWWDCEAIDDLIFHIIRAELDQKLSPIALLPHYLKAKLTNRQTKSRAFEVGEKHYDIGNDLFEAMLDSRMTYTCGHWKDLAHESNNLDAAQEQKLDLVCRKLGLKQGQHVLDIGCGWGSFAKFAAQKYGAKVTGLTVSREQVDRGRELCEGLPVDFKLQDYREETGFYDHVVSLGMFEHVGNKNYRTYMETAARAMRDDGLFVLHTIGHNRKTSGVDPWIEQYIFPNGIIPQSSLLARSFEGIFVMEDWQNFGPDYDPTLMAWYDHFVKAWPQLKTSGRYSDRFYRMWKYYLLACAGAFRARNIQLWQIVLSKGPVGRYDSAR